MKQVGDVIDHVEKNHDVYTPFLMLSVIFFLLLAFVNLPDYDEYQKTLEINTNYQKESN